jgi:hypothetical protein
MSAPAAAVRSGVCLVVMRSTHQGDFQFGLGLCLYCQLHVRYLKMTDLPALRLQYSMKHHPHDHLYLMEETVPVSAFRWLKVYDQLTRWGSCSTVEPESTVSPTIVTDVDVGTREVSDVAGTNGST